MELAIWSMAIWSYSTVGSKFVEATETSNLPSSFTEPTGNVLLSSVTTQNYIIITISSVFIGVILIIIFVLLIRKIRERCCWDYSRLLETYSSINYDDESIDEALDNCNDPAYTSCKLYVGHGLGVDTDSSNSGVDYDCMSVDSVLSINASSSSCVDCNSTDSPAELVNGLKATPQTFWRR